MTYQSTPTSHTFFLLRVFHNSGNYARYTRRTTMSKKSSTKELIIGGVVASLMMGGTAMTSLKSGQANTQTFFQVKELKGGYQLAAAEKKEEAKKTEVKEEKMCKE